MRWLLIFVLITVTGSFTKTFAQMQDAQLAAQYLATGDAQKAVDIYQRLYKGDNDTYYQYYAKCLISLKKFDEAEAITKKMQRKYPNEQEYAIMLGVIYTQKGEAEKAKQTYNAILDKLPADAGAISMLAGQFYQNNNIDYAIKTLEQGRKVLNNEHVFSYELITMYRFKGDKTSMVEEYLNFLATNANALNMAENTMSNIFDSPEDYDMLRSALYKRLQKDPQQTTFVNLLVWDFLQQKDFDQALNQALALNRRTNDDGMSIFDLCQTLLNNQAYEVAERGFQYLVDKGNSNPYYLSAKVELIDTKSRKITSGKYVQADLVELEKAYNDLLTEFGRNAGTAFAMQRLATLEAFKLHKTAEAQKLLEEVVAIPNLRPETLASCKLDLGDVYLINHNKWDAILLYGQVEKDFPNTDMGQDAKFRNAKMAYYTGDFEWAKRELDVLKAATSQLIANDALNLSLLISDNLSADSSGAALKVYARADLLIFAQEPEKAIQTLDSIDVKYPNNALSNDILMAKARIFIQQKNYSDAIPLLKKIYETHPDNLWADDAVFMLGDIYDNQLNDKALAKMYYQKIITDYPGSLWINEARKRFRILRGDQPAS